MDEITPDLVARIASRLFNERPSTQTSQAAPHSHSSATTGAPPAGAYPAAASTYHAGPQHLPEASTHGPSSHAGQPFPGSSYPYANQHSPFGSAAAPQGMAHQPAHFGSVNSPTASSPSQSYSQHAHSSQHTTHAPSFSGNAPYTPSLPSFPSNLPGMPTSPPGTPVSLPSSFPPDVPSTPSFAGAPSAPTNSPDGLNAFVQKIRQSHFGGRGQDTAGTTIFSSLRDQLSVGKAINSTGPRPFDVHAVRKDFPILHQRVHGRQLVWFDNAATTQKPQSVIDAISQFYETDNSNIHRAAHSLAARATDAYEKARQKVQTFIGAASIKEIVFVRGTTEGINFITQTFGRKFLQPGDEIVLSQLEHHASIVPWQFIAKERGAHIRVIPVNDRGEIMLEEYQKLLGPRTKVVALTHASNSLGTVLPIHDMTQMAKRYNARVVIDGAQSVAHLPVNMQQLGADFFVFSGHKIFGPTGIGVVYVKEELHDILPPWQGGGNMIRNVTFEETQFAEAPNKFEAGTPNIADAIGLGAALDYVSRLGLPNIAAYEHELLEYGTECLSRIGGLRLIGTAREKVGVMSFVLPNRRTEEVGKLLDQEGIAVRSGHHCSQPSLRRFGVESTVRPSLSIYNTREEIDRLVAAIKRIQLLPH